MGALGEGTCLLETSGGRDNRSAGEAEDSDNSDCPPSTRTILLKTQTGIVIRPQAGPTEDKHTSLLGAVSSQFWARDAFWRRSAKLIPSHPTR